MHQIGSGYCINLSVMDLFLRAICIIVGRILDIFSVKTRTINLDSEKWVELHIRTLMRVFILYCKRSIGIEISC